MLVELVGLAIVGALSGLAVAMYQVDSEQYDPDMRDDASERGGG